MSCNRLYCGALQAILGSVLVILVLGSCSPPVERLTGLAKVNDDAKIMFGRSSFDRSLELAIELAKANPPTEFTERGQMASAILMSGLAQGYKELAEGYRDGIKKLRGSSERPEYSRRRYDYYQYAKTHGLQLAELSTRFLQAQKESEVKNLTVELPYPAIEPPVSNQELAKVLAGMHLEDSEHAEAELKAIRICMRRSLTGALGIDEGNLSVALKQGSAKVSNVVFCLFLARQLVGITEIFGPKGTRENRIRIAVCDRADAVTQKVLDMLKQKPDKGLKKVAIGIEKDIKIARKSSS